MGEGSDALWEELSALADDFADLGRRLLHSSRQLHSPGLLPPASLLEEIERLRRASESLRARTCGLAAEHGVPVPQPSALEGLKGLADLLVAVTDAEERRPDVPSRAVAALEVIGRVLRLRHAQEAAYPPLLACQDQARALYSLVESAPARALGGVAAGLAENNHPFAHLLAMVEGREGLKDDLWESHFESVSRAFGPQLAAAAARSKLVIVPEESPAARLEEAVAITVQEPLPLPAEPVDEEPVRDVVTQAHETFPAGDGEGMTSAPPVLSPWTTDALSPPVISVVFPQLPRTRSSLTAARRLTRSARRRSVPTVERLESIRPLSFNVISGSLLLDACIAGTASGFQDVSGVIAGDLNSN
jgi:hypothetical protein